jgi:hypothetical protein
MLKITHNLIVLEQLDSILALFSLWLKVKTKFLAVEWRELLEYGTFKMLIKKKT